MSLAAIVRFGAASRHLNVLRRNAAWPSRRVNRASTGLDEATLAAVLQLKPTDWRHVDSPPKTARQISANDMLR